MSSSLEQYIQLLRLSVKNVKKYSCSSIISFALTNRHLDWSDGKEHLKGWRRHLFYFAKARYNRTIFPTSSLRARKCFSRPCSPSSPYLWRLRSRRRMTVAPGRGWGLSPTPCCLPAPLIERFPASASTTASTLSPALQAQSFALQQVLFDI